MFYFKFSETTYFDLHLIKKYEHLPLKESSQIRRNFWKLFPVGHHLTRTIVVTLAPDCERLIDFD